MHNDLIVLSPVRWDGPRQRPHHIVSRLALTRRTWFVEEPARLVGYPLLAVRERGDIAVVRLESDTTGSGGGFGDASLAYRRRPPDVVGPARGHRIVWMGSAHALDITTDLGAAVLVYDVTDARNVPAPTPVDTTAAHTAPLAAHRPSETRPST